MTLSNLAFNSPRSTPAASRSRAQKFTAQLPRGFCRHSPAKSRGLRLKHRTLLGAFAYRHRYVDAALPRSQHLSAPTKGCILGIKASLLGAVMIIVLIPQAAASQPPPPPKAPPSAEVLVREIHRLQNFLKQQAAASQPPPSAEVLVEIHRLQNLLKKQAAASLPLPPPNYPPSAALLSIERERHRQELLKQGQAAASLPPPPSRGPRSAAVLSLELDRLQRLLELRQWVMSHKRRGILGVIRTIVERRKVGGDDHPDEILAEVKKTLDVNSVTRTLQVLKNCPGHHGLTKFWTPNANYYCSICKIKGIYPAGTTMHGCRICDYDLCIDCYPGFNVWRKYNVDLEPFYGSISWNQQKSVAKQQWQELESKDGLQLEISGTSAKYRLVEQGLSFWDDVLLKCIREELGTSLPPPLPRGPRSANVLSLELDRLQRLLNQREERDRLQRLLKLSEAAISVDMISQHFGQPRPEIRPLIRTIVERRKVGGDDHPDEILAEVKKTLDVNSVTLTLQVHLQDEWSIYGICDMLKTTLYIPVFWAHPFDANITASDWQKLESKDGMQLEISGTSAKYRLVDQGQSCFWDEALLNCIREELGTSRPSTPRPKA